GRGRAEVYVHDLVQLLAPIFGERLLGIEPWRRGCLCLGRRQRGSCKRACTAGDSRRRHNEITPIDLVAIGHCPLLVRHCESKTPSSARSIEPCWSPQAEDRPLMKE